MKLEGGGGGGGGFRQKVRRISACVYFGGKFEWGITHGFSVLSCDNRPENPCSLHPKLSLNIFLLTN